MRPARTAPEPATGLVAAADRLGASFAARDLGAALDCFVADDDIGYVGSEHAESATGRAAVTRLLANVFARAEAYQWQVTRVVSARLYPGCAYLIAEADAVAHTDAGERTGFAYRLSGLLEPIGDQWRWRHCHGCEPAAG
jgi:ketosteroid isomerase-like protein